MLPSRLPRPAAIVRNLFVLVLAPIASIASLWALSSPTYAQPELAEISVFGPRPLSDAIMELSRKHGWRVTYEDAYYEYDGDLVDIMSFVPAPVNPTTTFIGRRQRGFAQQRLVFRYSVGDVARPAIVLTNLIAEYHKLSSAFEYRLEGQGDWFHVVPAASRNANGEWTARRSRLDVRITIPSADRSVAEALIAVEQALSKTAAAKIILGMGTNNLFWLPASWPPSPTRIERDPGAQNESARDVLARTLDATGRKMPWALLCAAAGGNCTLNFYSVGAR